MSKDVSPSLTRAQVRAFDRAAIERLGLPGIVLMENAGRNAARVIRNHVLREPQGKKVAIVCGGGNNGGDGFVIARHLANDGARVTVYLAADPASLAGDAATNHRVVAAMGLPIASVRTSPELAEAQKRWKKCDAIVDALLGTGFAGSVRPPLDAIIGAINEAGRGGLLSRGPAIVAIDLPSGLDADTGAPSNATVRAGLTITMVGRKVGFDAAGAADYTGQVIVVDIGAPASLLANL